MTVGELKKILEQHDDSKEILVPYDEYGRTSFMTRVNEEIYIAVKHDDKWDDNEYYYSEDDNGSDELWYTLKDHVDDGDNETPEGYVLKPALMFWM